MDEMRWGFPYGSRMRNHMMVVTGFCKTFQDHMGYKLCDSKKAVYRFDSEKKGLSIDRCDKCREMCSKQSNNEKVIVQTQDLKGFGLTYAFSQAKGCTDLQVLPHNKKKIVGVLPNGKAGFFFYDDPADILGIIEKYKLEPSFENDLVSVMSFQEEVPRVFGADLREAVARFYVWLKLGDKVEIPVMLVQSNEA